jgi:hypothetical protein
VAIRDGHAGRESACASLSRGGGLRRAETTEDRGHETPVSAGREQEQPTMYRKSIPLTAAALMLFAFGCGDADKNKVDERNEANRQMADAQEKLNEERAEAARQPGDPDEQEDVIEAKKHLGEEQDEAAREVAKAGAELQRFEAYKSGESAAAFATRAQSALDEITTEVAKLESSVGTLKTDKQEEIREDLADVREASAEAKKDLAELAGGADPGVVDDGKTGVTVAINRARRSLEEARTELAETETAEP